MVDALTAVLAGAITLLLPGLALALPLLLSRPGWSLHGVVIMAAGLSLALNALLLMTLTTLGLPFSSTSLAIAYAVLAAIGGFWLFRLFRHQAVRLGPALTGHWPWGLGLLGLFVGVFLLRLLPLGPLVVPPGVDTVHHVALVDMILQQQSVPPGWLPYWPVDEFSYHFGFHANAAAFALASGAAPLEAVALLGPYLVGLAALSVYLLVYRVTKSHRAGFIAALATGFLSVFPAFLLVWGRLPQLAGLVLVLVTLALLIEFFTSKPTWPYLLVASAMLAGLFLTHYRMLLFLFFGFVALLLANVVREASLKTAWEALVRVAPVAGLALLMASPWILHLLQSPLATGTLSRPLLDSELVVFERVARPLAYPSSVWLLSLSILGVLLTALRRQVEFVLFAAWAGLSWFFSSPFHVPHPFFGLLDTVTWVSVAFVFQVAFVATGLLVVLEALRDRKPWNHVVYALAAAGILAAGISGTGVIAVEADAMVTPADLRAFSWMEGNVPEDAFFATNVGINPFFGFPEPADAGVWITYFTGRAQVAPGLGALTGVSPSSPYLAILQPLPGVVANVGSFDSFLYLREIGITHLYLGARNTGPMIVSDVETAPWYTVVYQEKATIAEMVDLPTLNPLVLRGGRDWSSLQNGYAIAREWEENGTVLESYTFQDFRVNYSLPMEEPGRYRISLRLADFVANDWETGEPLSGVRFELDGQVLLDHTHGANTIRWLSMEVTTSDPGIHTFTVRNRDPGLPFRLSLGSIVVEFLGAA